MPLALGLAALGWYNFARFGSVFETGIKYQLAGIPLQKWEGKTSSSLYVVQNLYNYLLNPPKFTDGFPYMKPDDGVRKRSVIAAISLPRMYSAQPITGLLYSAPFILFAIVPAVSIFRRRRGPGNEFDQWLLMWLIVALLGSFLSAVAFLGFFFWTAERYLGDFMPALLLLGVIGFWQLILASTGRRLVRAIYVFLAVALITTSLAVSNVLAIGINHSDFSPAALQLLGSLSTLFRP